ncbi:MAG: GLPGLI family protein [Lewinella sp.]|nr:GLPGLI family protein [Lewinella sp.]
MRLLLLSLLLIITSPVGAQVSCCTRVCYDVFGPAPADSSWRSELLLCGAQAWYRSIAMPDTAVAKGSPLVADGWRSTETNDGITWTLHDETRLIGIFRCRKASATVDGRQVTAWYAPELPDAGGPAELAGLPGLILQATDHDRQTQYVFSRLERFSRAHLSAGAYRQLPAVIRQLLADQ